jgi:hypothetical protein
MAPLGRLTWQPSHSFFFPGPESSEELPQKWLVNFLSLLSSLFLVATNPFGCCPIMAGQLPFSPFLPRTIQKLPEMASQSPFSPLFPVPNCLNPKTSVSSVPSAAGPWNSVTLCEVLVRPPESPGTHPPLKLRCAIFVGETGGTQEASMTGKEREETP